MFRGWALVMCFAEWLGMGLRVYKCPGEDKHHHDRHGQHALQESALEVIHRVQSNYLCEPAYTITVAV